MASFPPFRFVSAELGGCVVAVKYGVVVEAVDNVEALATGDPTKNV